MVRPFTDALKDEKYTQLLQTGWGTCCEKKIVLAAAAADDRGPGLACDFFI